MLDTISKPEFDFKKYESVFNWIELHTKQNKQYVNVNKWFEIDGMSIYLRISTRYLNFKKETNVIDISSVNIENELKRNKLRFTEFLYCLEYTFPNNFIYVENVLEKRFQEFFKRKNYIQLPNDLNNEIPCYYKAPKMQ